MAASQTQNPAVKLESKSAKKKKAKVEVVEAPAAVPEVAGSNNPSDNNNSDGAYESPYIKELYK